MFKQNVIDALCKAADKEKIPQAHLLALVECETNGDPFEVDGHTPSLLFERHVFYKQIKQRAPSLLNEALRLGFARKTWDRKTQYKDQGTSAGRLALIERVRALHQECANLSASWGIGQTMGFNHTHNGYPSATAMVAAMDGDLAEQIEAMIGELRHSGIIEPLRRGEWSTVARKYNGPGYKQNQYDTRMAAACKRWERKLSAGAKKMWPEDSLSKDEITAIQEKLWARGFKMVGVRDGAWGTNTIGALSAFQAHEGLPVNGHYDKATAAALDESDDARPMSFVRAEASVDDLREDGSRTIAVADNLSFWGKCKVWLGIGSGGGYAADQAGFFDRAGDVADKLEQGRSLWERFGDWVHPVLSSPLVPYMAVALAVVGFFVWRDSRKIKAFRVEDFRTGEHAG